MTRETKECEARALKLAPQERAALAQQLIASLDAPDDAENEILWLEEVERRYQEYKKGKIPALCAAADRRCVRAAKHPASLLTAPLSIC